MSTSLDLGSLDVNPESRMAIKGLRDEANSETVGSLASQYGSGVQKAQGLIKSDNAFNQGLGGADNAMLEAVQNKYKSKYQGNFNQIANKNVASAQSDHLRKLETATQLAEKELEANRQKEILAYKMKQAKKAMRGQMLGSILGIAGAGAGAYFGGPTGAMAGGQVGSAAGQSIGSS